MINIQLQNGDIQGDVIPTLTSPLSPGGQPSINLLPGNSWYSPGGAFRLAFQASSVTLVLQVINLVSRAWEQGTPMNPNDPNVVQWLPIWTPFPLPFGTVGSSATVVSMQVDGNLVVYAGPNPIFNTQTEGNEHAILRVQDDGNVVIYRQDGSAAWQTKTAASEAPGSPGPPFSSF